MTAAPWRVVVTGAAGGLGSAVARRFAVDGANVLLTDVVDGVHQVAAGLQDGGPDGQIHAATADVRDAEATAAVVRGCVEAWGGLDVLVNTAGGSLSTLTSQPDKPLWEVSAEEWRLLLDVNLTGSFNWIQAVTAVMRRQGSGCILLVASGTGVRPGPGMAGYAAAKAGVVGLMRGAARDLGPFGIRVNALNPGFIPHRNFPASTIAQHADRYRSDTMLGRLSTPEDFAEFTCRIAGMTAISGQTFTLDSRIVS